MFSDAGAPGAEVISRSTAKTNVIAQGIDHDISVKVDIHISSTSSKVQENTSSEAPTESTPLYPKLPNQYYSNTPNHSNITCCFISLAACLGIPALATLGFFVAKILKQNDHHSTPPSPPDHHGCTSDNAPLTYTYNIPYVPGGQVCVVNHGDSIELQSISFVSNAEITELPWSSNNGIPLFPWGSTLKQTLNPDGLTYTNVIHFPSSQPSVTLPNNQQACVEFNIASATGPFGVAMDPNSVTVNGNTLPIDGKQNCPDPTPGYRSSGWFPQWGIYNTTANYPVSQIPTPPPINEVIYTFGDILPNGTISTADSYADSFSLPALSMLIKKFIRT